MDLPAASPAARLFAGVTDPRVERTRRHPRCDILLMAPCATLAGAEGFCDIAAWAQTKAGWLRTFLDLPGGVPSHDTFERVFRRLEPKELHACFLRWRESGGGGGAGRQAAIDGKTLRRSFDGAGGQPARHVVSAFATEGLGLVLGQVAVADKGNEITAIPELLRLLALERAPGRRLPAGPQGQPSRPLRGRAAALWRPGRPPWRGNNPRGPRASKRTTDASKPAAPWPWGRWLCWAVFVGLPPGQRCKAWGWSKRAASRPPVALPAWGGASF